VTSVGLDEGKLRKLLTRPQPGGAPGRTQKEKPQNTHGKKREKKRSKTGTRGEATRVRSRGETSGGGPESANVWGGPLVGGRTPGSKRSGTKVNKSKRPLTKENQGSRPERSRKKRAWKAVW